MEVGEEKDQVSMSPTKFNFPHSSLLSIMTREEMIVASSIINIWDFFPTCHSSIKLEFGGAIYLNLSESNVVGFLKKLLKKKNIFIYG